MNKIPKTSKKKFFEVEIPLTTSKVHVFDHAPELAHGKTVKLDLTRSLKGKNLELRAKINYTEGKLVGELVSLELMKTYVRKVMRKRADYIEDSFETQSKDATLRIKPFLITRQKVSNNILKELRNQTKKFIISKATVRTSRELFADIMSNKLQKEIAAKLKKIYPLSLAEIRVIQIVNPSSTPVAQEEVKEQ